MRIIVIPAIPNTPLRQRAAEIGLALGSRHSVIVVQGERQPPGLSKVAKLAWHVRQACTVSWRRISPRVVLLRLPSLPHYPVASCDYQSALLGLFARLWGADAVFTEGVGELRAPRHSGVRIVYDILDDHPAGWERIGRPDVARRIRAFMASEIARADAVTASSRVLVDLAVRVFGRSATLVPNGVRVAEHRDAVLAPTAELRARLGLGAGPVLGFTGGLDGWVDVPLAIAALKLVRQEAPAAQLLVVGDGMRATEFRAAGAVVTGFVPPAAVPAYVALFDVGLVPFERSPLTDAMLPIKVFDYAASRKPVVATPLAAYDGEDLPFLTLAEAEPQTFAAAVRAAMARGWDPAWDASVDRYDWGIVARPVEELLAAPVRSRGAPLGPE